MNVKQEIKDIKKNIKRIDEKSEITTEKLDEKLNKNVKNIFENFEILAKQTTAKIAGLKRQITSLKKNGHIEKED